MKKKFFTAITTMFICFLFLGVCFTGANLFQMNQDLRTIQEKISNISEQCQSFQESFQTIREQTENLVTQMEEMQAEYEQQLQQENLTQSSAAAELQPGQILAYEDAMQRYDAGFSSRMIQTGDDVYNRIYGKSYRENENVGLEDLRYLTLLHYNFNHEIQVGEMIVNAAVEQDVLNIFKELFDYEYEIQSIYLVDNYWTGDGDSTDSASIDENNTSCFNYRVVTGGSNLSNHAYGCAIDINPQQNPYIWMTESGWAWSHDNASPYVDRSSGNPHVIVSGDICCSIFEKYGFQWGGYWSDPIDYQHFEKRLF